ncbi:MAG: type I restriction enzyme HsdR N-terminal domain-containing protein [Bacteroidetes bacterium]|nr:type I restriction enzyme HsdR N-terminal domain-containing protein [Bacteroidota bacterium]
MQELNLPKYQFKLKEADGKIKIFDAFRKRYVVLTPEEWVRQNFLQYLITEKKYAASLIAVEAGLKYNELQKRADILVYDKQGSPFLLVECKAPEVKISQDVFDQVARYNMSFKVTYLVVTNGMDHFCCKMDYEKNNYRFLEEIPVF